MRTLLIRVSAITLFSLLAGACSASADVSTSDPAPTAEASDSLTETVEEAEPVLVIAALDVDKPAAEVLTMGDGTHRGSRKSCTPELAAAWE